MSQPVTIQNTLISDTEDGQDRYVLSQWIARSISPLLLLISRIIKEICWGDVSFPPLGQPVLITLPPLLSAHTGGGDELELIPPGRKFEAPLSPW